MDKEWKPSDFRETAQFTGKIITIFFHDFYNILNFDEFCRTRSFEFLDSGLTKHLEINFGFLEFL
jgi:hypothetical protein